MNKSNKSKSYLNKMKNFYPGYEIEKYLTREACQAGIDARNSLPEDLKEKLDKDYYEAKDYAHQHNFYEPCSGMHYAWHRGFTTKKHFSDYSDQDAIDSEIISDEEHEEIKNSFIVKPVKSKWWNWLSWFI